MGFKGSVDTCGFCYGVWGILAPYPSDQLAKPIGILKRVPTILSRPGLQKHKKAMFELNNLVKVTLEVIQCMFELGEAIHLASTVQKIYQHCQ